MTDSHFLPVFPPLPEPGPPAEVSSPSRRSTPPLEPCKLDPSEFDLDFDSAFDDAEPEPEPGDFADWDPDPWDEY